MEKDYKDLGEKSILDTFNIALAKIAGKFAKEHKPFDEPCARLDFGDRLEQAQRESERGQGFVGELKIDIGDLDKYGDANRFETLGEEEDIQDKFVEGSRIQVVIGHTVDYKCKNRGHGISVFTPKGEYKKKAPNTDDKED